MKPLVLLALLLATPFMAASAPAQTITVQSGEHDGFTRLVLEIGTPANWALGRTGDGYELRLDRPGTRYDLSQVYKLIPRDRLAAIWVDPETGNLRLAIGCACHAMPFEFRPNVIVVDLRDGPPPKGSSFENTFDGSGLPQLVGRRTMRPRARPGTAAPAYDWRAITRMPTSASGSATVAMPMLSPAVDLAPLRDTLLRQMSQGAAKGVVDLTRPPQRHDDPIIAETPDFLPLKQMHIGEDLGLAAGTLRPLPETLTATGADCLADDKLDIAAWGKELPVAEQMATALTGLTGEFDRPEAAAVSRAVRFYLFLGFGAEARQLLRDLDIAPEDKAIWQTMAIILDEESPPAGPFDGMMVCDTAAALWSVLAHPQLSAGDVPHKTAILRSFSALPLHLRRHLGPSLAARFFERGDSETSRAVRDAILRAPGNPGPQVRLMGAELDLAMGNRDAADQVLRALAAEGGPGAAEALIAHAETLFERGEPVDMQTVTALAALAFEHRGSRLEPALQRAHLLALAAAGDFDSAFRQRAFAPEAEPDLWRILANHGADSALLEHAVLPDATAPPEVPLATRRKLAVRLVALGFAEPALHWLAEILAPDAKATAEDRLLAARVQMDRHDIREALRLVAGMSGPEADSLRAKAQVRLGDLIGATRLFAALGDGSAEQRTARQAHAWQLIFDRGEDPWRAAAQLVLSSAENAGGSASVELTEIPGPLARGRQAVAESAAARQTLLSLLSQVSVPAAVTAATN
ncbi:MAG: hypothetical protein Q8P60_16750 [Pseudorhodobacter sp.]|nr:hypothetical protein [Pseudorhodobacter sp.]